MGRQTRQARRLAARRQQAQTRRPRALNRPLVAGAAVVAAAIAIFVLAAAGIFKGPGGTANGLSAADATATSIVQALGTGYTVDGIYCDPAGGMPPGRPHIHADVVIYDHGVRWQMNPNVGHDYNHDCLFWVHAHADAGYGVIHMESPRPIHPTLGAWNAVALHSVGKSAEMQLRPRPGEQQRVYVNDRPYHGDISRLPLQNHMSITIEYGPPWVRPHLFDFRAYQL